ncbi:ABC transporter ATP-binding protein [Galactobacillus timonensis]|uniref:ABC transporter ATP-binding protein n=1 Tax=Galactobacillus timonensis TaxID=2041840 RepID=UPI000C817537|nr:ABC transporter ATP-binding protein [Galactobacillus timonensis]
MKQKKHASTLTRLLKVIAKYRLWVVVSFLSAGISAILQLYIPILFGRAIDYIIGPKNVDFTAIGTILIRILILLLITAAITWIMNLVNNRLCYRTIQDIRAKAIRKIQHLPLSTLDAQSSGDLVQRIIADTDQMSDGLLLGFSQLFSGIVTIAVTLIFMFQTDVMISLLVVALTPLSFFVARFIASRSYTMFHKQTEVRGRQTALINEMISAEKTVQAFQYQERASQRFSSLNKELREDSIKAIFFSSLTNPSTRAVNNVIYAAVAWIGASHILKGTLTVGGLTVLLSYANQYMKPFNDISSVITELQNSLACADRIFTLLDEEDETPDSANALTVTQGAVDLSHVNFSYRPDVPLIQDFTVHAKPGTLTAIVGPTGCGKTTLINLLMRFYDVNGGTISIDGQDTKAASRASLRQNFGMVLQDTWLKEATVRENIAFGCPDATEEEIIAAAKESHSWEFIKKMSNGLDAPVRDDDLSQGQKQLLCISRVMLAKPRMLILDEATSSIDTRTELQVQEAFDRLMSGRTSFIVAHRLSTIQNADQIIVMNHGQIMEQGTHKELLARNGFYAQLYHAQFEQVH